MSLDTGCAGAMPLVIDVAMPLPPLPPSPALNAVDGPQTENVEIPSVLKRFDRFVAAVPVKPVCKLRFDVLADVFALKQMGGGFEWSKSKYSKTPATRPLVFGASAAHAVVLFVGLVVGLL